jgi:hypothetical protein
VLNLPTPTTIIQIVTGSAVTSITTFASWVDLQIAGNNVVPGSTGVVINGAGTTPIVGAPAAGYSRNVKYLSIVNTSALPCVITIQETNGTITVPLFQSFTLLPGYSIQYNTDGDGFRVYDSTGHILVSEIETIVVGGVALSAGAQLASSGTVSFSNENGVSFGLNAGTLTASVIAGNVNFSAGTTSNNLSAVTFANSNGISFGLNASTVTASFSSFGGQTISCFSQDADFVTNFTANQNALSVQKVSLPMNLRATQLAILADFRGTNISSDAVTMSHAVYTLSGGTASLASSGSRVVTWASGAPYLSVSGTQYRSVGVSYSMTPGDYLFAWCVSTANGVVVRPFGRMAANIVGGLDGVESSAFLNGSSVSTVHAFPASIAVTDTGYARTGLSALLQPGAILFGT